MSSSVRRSPHARVRASSSRLRAVAASAVMPLALAVCALSGAADAQAATTPCGATGTFSQTATTDSCTYAPANTSTAITNGTFTVPAYASQIDITAIGGEGGGGNASRSSGGYGASVISNGVTVTAGTALTVDVGEQR